MAHEWKVGDRFSVEGVITETADSDGDYKAIFDGHTIGGCVIAAEMACAKLIHPAAPEPEKLDVTKPIWTKEGAHHVVEYVATTTDGAVVVRWPSEFVEILNASELENIPDNEDECTTLRAEIDRLRALLTPQKPLDADEVTKPGWYWVRNTRCPYWKLRYVAPTLGKGGTVVGFQFVGPLKAPENEYGI